MPVVVSFPRLLEAHALQGLSGVSEDLKSVVGTCDLLAAEQLREYRDIRMWEALSSFALVTYARCFHKGVRAPLDPSLLQSANADLYFKHQYFFDLRNKHIAHSVSKYEENRLIAYVGLESGVVTEVARVEVETRKMIGFSDADIPALRQLCDFWMVEVAQSKAVEEKRVIEALNRLPQRRWRAFFGEKLPQLLDQDAHKTRKTEP